MPSMRSNVLKVVLLAIFVLLGWRMYQAFQPEYIYSENPVWLDQLKRHKGVRETPGSDCHDWIKEGYLYCKLPERLHDDNQTSWCSSGLNQVMREVYIVGTKNARAESWLNWGARAPTKQGAICVFLDSGFYHVTVLEKAEPVVLNGVEYYECLGCNQSDTVQTSRYKTSSLKGMRWPTIKERMEQ